MMALGNGAATTGYDEVAAVNGKAASHEVNRLFNRGGGCCGCNGGGYSGCSGYSSDCGCFGGGRGGLFHRGRRGGCCGSDACNTCCGAVSACGCNGAAAASACGCCGVAAPACGCNGSVAPAKDKDEDEDEDSASAAKPATIVVQLPAEAKLSFNEVATKSTATTRSFATPALKAGQEYFYTVKATIVRDGQTVTTSKRIAVLAGKETRLTLDFPTASVAQR
jgi:uncharacterized protein (TIGR03000 family)